MEKFSMDAGPDENKERGNWSGRLDFLLSCIGFAVGLGNVWRFPYLCYDNGGASFLIPYVIMLVTAGMPLFYLELAFGQFSSQGPISVWKAVPFLKGVGYAMIMISLMTCIYYNMIIAWTLFYLFASFTGELPWQHCGHPWNTPACKERIAINSTAVNITQTWCNMMQKENMTDNMDYIGNCTVKSTTPSDEYWRLYVLDVSTSIEDGFGEIRWQLALCLLLAWIVIFLCLIKGIKSSGKVVYVTAVFPYIVLIILVVRGCTLPGAWNGIKFYLVPELEKLRDSKPWGKAAVQIFYSLGISFGGLMTMSSYNRFHNNCYRDAVLVSCINCGTSIFAGFAIFSVLGFMATITNQEVSDVVNSDAGLAFVAYPEGIAMMPIAPLWSILFFIMLFTLGLDSQFAMMETVISGIVDEFPGTFRKRKIPLTLGLCICLFLLGLPQCSRAGIYILTLFDWYCAGFSLFIVALIEIIGIMYIYNLSTEPMRWSDDIAMMIGYKPNYYWLAMWFVVSPFMICFIIIFSAIKHTEVKYSGQSYPRYVELIGWGMVGVSIIFIPLIGLIQLCKKGYPGAFRPEEDWGPAVDEHRTGRYARLIKADMGQYDGQYNPGFKGSLENNHM